MSNLKRQSPDTQASEVDSVEKSARVYFSAGDIPEPLIQEIKQEIRKQFAGPNGQGLLDMDPHAIEVGKNHLEKVRKLVRSLLEAKAPGQYEADGIGSILVTKKTAQSPRPPTAPTPPVIHERDEDDDNKHWTTSADWAAMKRKPKKKL